MLSHFPKLLTSRYYLPFFVFGFRRELLHSYGFEHIGTLDNMEKAGLLKRQVYHFTLVISEVVSIVVPNKYFN